MLYKLNIIIQDRDELSCVVLRQIFYNNDYKETLNHILQNWTWWYDGKINTIGMPNCDTGKYNTAWYKLVD